MKQENRLRRIVESGDVAVGAQAATMSPAVIEACGDLGLDFVWLDLEHKGPSPYDSTATEAFSRAAETAGTELLVRLPSGDPPLVRKVLDSGVRNLIVPRVESAEDVRRAARAARFEYDDGPGDRGSSFSRATGWGGNEDGYPDREDESVLLGAMVESADAIADIDEILSVPELGFVRVGHGDLSTSLGVPMEKDHPEVGERKEVVRRACEEHGVPLSGTATTRSEAKSAVDAGYRILTIGKDLRMLRSVIGDRQEAVRDGSRDG